MSRQQQSVPPWVLWTLGVIGLGAFVATWSGWVGLGALTGFGKVRPLPGIWDSLEINTAVTLPLGIEAYAFLALGAWLSGWAPTKTAAMFAMVSGLGSIVIGMSAQVAYHLLVTSRETMPGGHAPWQVVLAVACVPNTVLGLGSILAHLLRPGAPGDEQVEVEAPKASRRRKSVQEPVLPLQVLETASTPGELEVSTPPVRIQGSSTVPPEVRERARAMVLEAEQAGRRLGRGRLQEELDLTEHHAKTLIQEIRRQLQETGELQ